ncbi:MAG: trigger factor family protein [Bacteroidales bacterium]|jgi:trigger factor|nr:trigger factor family protein [Bacteroidales bacterium]
MNISREENGKLTSILRIAITKDDYSKELDEQLRTYRRKVTLPGFRAGHVPMAMVKRDYELPLKVEIINKKLNDSMFEYIDTQKIEILGTPLANEEKTSISWNEDSEYVFYFDIALKPEFTLKLESIKETYYRVSPNEELLNNYINDIQKRFGQFSSPEKVELTDLVYGEIVQLDEEGNEKEGGIKHITSISIDKIAQKTIQNKFFSKQKDDSITFNAKKAFTNANDLAAILGVDKQKAEEFSSEVKFTISSINRIVPHALDEELFEKVFPNQNIKTEDSFKEKAKEELSSTYAKEADRYFLNKASENLVKTTNIEFDDSFMKRWILSNQEGKLSPEDLDRDYPKYKDSMVWQLIEEKLSKLYDLNITKEEVKQYYKDAVLSTYFPKVDTASEEELKERENAMEGILESVMKNENQTKQIYEYLFDQKVIEILKNNMKITEKKVNTDEFIEIINKKEE